MLQTAGTWAYPYQEGLPNELFQANRSKFLANFRLALGGTREESKTNAIAFFKGIGDVPIYNSDVNYPFHQEGNFYYLFGVQEPDCYGALDIDSGKPTLFVPKTSYLYKIWMTVLTKEDFEKKYEIEEVVFTDDMEAWLVERKATRVFVNGGVNTDSGLENLLPEDKYLKSIESIDKENMYEVLANTRVTKTELEIDVMRWATKITVEGHVEVLKKIRDGMRESDLESIFKYFCELKYKTGRVQPYCSIVGCGPTAATLHYNDNNKRVNDGETMLIDQAHSVHHYASDITSSFPVNGKFTEKQAAIYSLVLKANREVMKVLKAGVAWPDMQLLAERIILQGLIDLGLIHGDLEEMIEGRIGFIFMPHGLGHLIGLEVHDVGGYLKSTPARIMRPGLKNLRTARVLEANTFITVEPGFYFRDFLLDGEFGADLAVADPKKYLNRAVISEYQKEISGVRIEDVVLVTADGCDNLSKDLPRTVDEIEACMKRD
jgi:Xaa-Pro dipeptidase